MKNLNWKRKLAGLLAAAGLLTPAATQAAGLNTNLVINPSFENVDLGDTGPFTSVRLLDWIDTNGAGDDTFSYPYSSSYSGIPAPLGSGDWHFSGGFNTAIDEPLVQQSIDVGMGASGTLIASGGAAYNLSAYFSSYRNQDDSSFVRAGFQDSSGTEIGAAQVGGLDFVQGTIPISAGQRDWGRDVAVGLVPTGTSSVLLQIVSSDPDVNHDGYVDLVDFQISDQLRLPVFDLEIDRGDGGITLSNKTGGAVHISGYSITSDASAFDPQNWLSIADNYDADSDQSVDAVNRWTELTNSAVSTDLSEAELGSGTGAILATDQRINLSDSGAWIHNSTEELMFEYVSDGEVVQGLIAFVGNYIDFNNDGNIDTLDVDALVAEIIAGTHDPEFDVNGNAVVDGDDLEQWRVEAAAANGFGEAYLRGDANLDGTVNAGDLNALGLSWLQSPNTWSAGDFNADGVANVSDLNVLGLHWRQTIAVGPATPTVPEPSPLLLIGMGFVWMILARR